MPARVVAVCISERKGEKKTPVESVELRPDHGIVGDAHAGKWHRQISLLAIESIRKMQKMGLDVDLFRHCNSASGQQEDQLQSPLPSHS